MSVRSMLTQECKIRRAPTRTPSGLGVVTPAFADVAVNVPVLIQHHAARFLRGDQGINITYTATAFFVPTQDVRPKPGQTEQADQIVLTKNGTGTYMVKGVMDEAGKQAVLKVALEVE